MTRKITLMVALLLAVVMLFASCAEMAAIVGSETDGSGNADLKWSLSTAYKRAQDLGYGGTLEEFLATIQGADGKDGENGVNGTNGKDGSDGIGIALMVVNENGELIITLTDDSSVNLGVIRGKDGLDGKDGKDGKDGTNGKDGANGRDGVDGKDGKDGKDGVDGKGVEHAEINASGELIVTYTDGSTQNVGKVASDEHRHLWDDGKIFEEPDFVNYGMKIYVCSECNEIKWEYLPPYPSDSIIYRVHADNEACVYKAGPDVVTADIADTYQGKPVTRINSYAFGGCRKLKSVTIPDSITCIEPGAFYNCSSLKFNSTDNGENETQLVPRWIPKESFEENIMKPLQEAVEAELLSQWSYDKFMAYYDEKGLDLETTEAARQNLVQTFPILENPNVHIYVLDLASSDEELAYLEQIMKDYCTDTYTLEQMRVDHMQTGYIPSVYYLGNAQNPYYAIVGYSTNGSTYTVAIHPDAKIIADGAFTGYETLQNITIPDGVIRIGEYSFAGCSNLQSVKLPNSDHFIFHLNAINGCSTLKELWLPVNLSLDLTTDSGQRFSDLSTIHYAGTTAQWEELGQDSFWHSRGSNYLKVICSDGNYGPALPDLQNREIRILTVNQPYYLPPDGQETILDQHLYLRNMRLEEDFNCSLVYHSVASNSYLPTCQNYIFAGESVDLLSAPASVAAQSTPALVPNLENLLEIPYEYDLLGEDWAPAGLDSFVQNNALYSLVSKSSVPTMLAANAVFCNKGVLAKYGLDYTYLSDLIFDGDWTYEELLKINRGLYCDYDGDGIISENDCCGFVMPVSFAPALAYGMGVRMYEEHLFNCREPDINCVENIYQSFFGNNNEGDYFLSDNALTMFQNGRALMTVGNLGQLQNSVDNRGDIRILPLPKHDNLQVSYFTPLSWSYDVWNIPNTAPDSEVLLMFLTRMFQFDCDAGRTRTMEYLLRQRWDDNDYQIEMMILDSIVVDFEWSHEGPLGGYSLIREAMNDTSSFTLASRCAQNKSIINAKLESLLAKYRNE